MHHKMLWRKPFGCCLQPILRLVAPSIRLGGKRVRGFFPAFFYIYILPFHRATAPFPGSWFHGISIAAQKTCTYTHTLIYFTDYHMIPALTNGLASCARCAGRSLISWVSNFGLALLTHFFTVDLSAVSPLSGQKKTLSCHFPRLRPWIEVFLVKLV